MEEAASRGQLSRAATPPVGERERRELLLAVVVVAVAAGILRLDMLRWPEPAMDERVYLAAFERVRAAGDPYAVVGFLYTPLYARIGAAFVAAAGAWPFLLAHRLASVLGLGVLVWAALRGSRWPPAARAAAAVAVVLSPLVGNGLGAGNSGVALVGPLLALLHVLPRRPALAGALVGLLNALKPTSLATLVVMAAPARGSLRVPRWAVTGAAAAAAALAAGLAVGWRDLPRWLALAEEPCLTAYNLAPLRVLHTWGATVPAGWVFVAATAAGALFAARRATTHRARVAVAGTTALLGLPMVNPHSYLLTLPAQALALEHAFAGWSAARRGGRGRGRATAELALVCAAVVSAHGAEGGITPTLLPLPVQGAITAISLLAAVALTVYGVARDGVAVAATGAGAPLPAAAAAGPARGPLGDAA